MIEEKVINEIDTLLMGQGLNESSVSDCRNRWPNIHFTFCSDDDVCGPTAFLESDGFSIYLIDGREHCLNFTSSTENATGLVLAEHEKENI